jgi:type 1 glutamine amidotransferase
MHLPFLVLAFCLAAMPSFLCAAAPEVKNEANARKPVVRPKSMKEEPPQRDPAEVQRVLASVPSGNFTRPITLTLVASKQDHGPGEHDYPAWQTNWAKMLARATNVQVETAWQWPIADQFRRSDVLVFYYWNRDWNSNRYAQLTQFFARGGGVVSLHSSCIADREPEPLAEFLGLSAQPKRTKYRHGGLDLTFVAPEQLPLTRGFKPCRLVDETYWPMIGDPARVHVLATAVEENQPHPMAWTFTRDRGRVWATVLGHYAMTYDDPFFRILVLRGIAWAAKEPEGRLQHLATAEVAVE